MNKEELEQQISVLQERVEANKTMSQNYENDLVKAKQKLADINKPEITPMMIDNIHSAIEKAVEGFDFCNTDNYEVEFGMEYDGKVHLESVDLSCAYELTEQIVTKVCELFVEAEELDTTEPDNHKVTHVEKVI